MHKPKTNYQVGALDGVPLCNVFDSRTYAPLRHRGMVCGVRGTVQRGGQSVPMVARVHLTPTKQNGPKPKHERRGVVEESLKTIQNNIFLKQGPRPVKLLIIPCSAEEE